MGSIAITGISGSMNEQRQPANSNRKLSPHYTTFLDEETDVVVVEDDSVQLSEEAQHLRDAGVSLDNAA